MSTIALQQRRDRNTGIIASIVFHVLLCILFLFVGLTQWDPPIPEQVVEVLMEGGGGEVGGGASQPETNNTPASSPESNPEDVATDEHSDVEVVKPIKKDPKPNEKPVVKPPKVDHRLSDALNQWNTKPETPNTQPSDNPNPGPGGKGKGLFEGNGWALRPGTGDGSGGSGTGRGLARGPDLSERPPLQNPTWVEVKVMVDPQGNVLRVSIANTGTSDVAIQNVALRAAKTARFIAMQGAPPEVAYYIKLRFVPS